MSRVGRTLVALLSALLLAGGAAIALGLLAGPAAAEPAPADVAAAGSPIIPNPQFVRLQVDEITPHVVTASTTGPVTARGRVINDGDRDVRGLQVRLERAPKVASASELRTALRTEPTEQDTASAFITVSDKLSPGDSAPFSVSLPVRGNLDNSRGLTEVGVYPMLVNVNGEPDFGGRARLDVAHFLLPVLSLPPDPGAANPPGASTPAAPPKQGPATTGITVLWPLADRPRLRPSAIGAPPLLSDDDLARSFAAGGRLDGLLQAVEQRTTGSADPTGALGNSLCLGVDPDLLVTAEDMTRGYQVLGANGQTTPGTGGPAANAWLQRLKAVAKQRCVLAMPWSQADLNALSRSSLPDLVSQAVASGRDVVAKSLGLPAVTNVVWPDGGFLTERTAAGLPRLGTKTVLVSSDGVEPAEDSGLAPGTRTVKLAAEGGSLGAGLIDAPAETALAATGSGRDRQLRLQDALGAMTWPAITTAQNGDGGTRSARGAVTGAVLLAPPQVWDIDGDQAQTLLDGVSALLRSGAATAAPLPALVNGATTSPTTAQLDYPVQASSTEVPPRTTAAIAAGLADLDQFGRALQRDPQSGVTPDDLLSPLRLALLRAASTSFAEDDAGSAAEVDAARQALTRLHDEVSLQAPSGTYTLASAQSPLLLVVRNDLPVSIDVRVSVDAPAGQRATDIGVQPLPAGSSRQLQVPTDVSRTGQFAVDVALSTDSGQQLGESARLQVRSTAYGPATALATAGAALVLLALVGRRLWHRFRGQPDRADDFPVVP
ncbi:MAG: DUF6049 family protein [Mycobacteriaceae bacterium]